MTYPRRQLVVPGSEGAYHCITRCVRHAFLCGFDECKKRDYEHRRGWIEKRLLELASIFAIGLYGYAVMHNHVHVIVTVTPAVAKQWADGEVVDRWQRLFPVRDETARESRRKQALADPNQIALYRARLADLSWFMRCLAEPIARRANAEDEVTGRFWEGRYKCQALLDERAILAALAYVDLNPVRAGIAPNLPASSHTGVARRMRLLAERRVEPTAHLRPLAGPISPLLPQLTEAEYIDLVDHTGRSLHPTKHGRIAEHEPPALRRLGFTNAGWSTQVRGIGSGYWRAVGAVDAMLAKARAMHQAWLRGIGFARQLEPTTR